MSIYSLSFSLKQLICLCLFFFIRFFLFSLIVYFFLGGVYLAVIFFFFRICITWTVSFVFSLLLLFRWFLLLLLLFVPFYIFFKRYNAMQCTREQHIRTVLFAFIHSCFFCTSAVCVELSLSLFSSWSRKGEQRRKVQENFIFRVVLFPP